MLMIIVHSLHNVHEMNAYRAGQVCVSVHMIQQTDLDEIWYGRYAIGEYPKILLLNFLQSVIPTWWTNKLLRWDRH
jgi:hypothetical protein